MKKMRLTALVALGARPRARRRRRERGRQHPPTAPKADVTAALVSDIGKFNDRGVQPDPARRASTRAKTQLGVKTIALQSNSAQRLHPEPDARPCGSTPNLVIAAGFLLADATATMAKKFPNTHFAITDYSVQGAPFADKKGKPLFKNVEGLTYAANEAGCLVGVLAAKMAQKTGKKIDRRRRRPQDPAGRHLDRRLQVLRPEGGPGHEGAHRLLAGLRRDRTSARRSPRTRSRQGAQVRLPGRRRLRPRHAEGGRRGRQAGASASTSTSTTLAQARPDERDQARRHRRLPGGPAGEGRQVPGRHRPASST